jgi:hypothetical protein
MTVISHVRNFALRDKEANEYGAFDEKQYHQSAFKAANRCKKANSNRSHPFQGTWDKEVAYFQDMKTPCQSIKASLKATLKTYRILIDVF